MILPWLWYAGMSSLYAFMAGLLTTYYGQGATGSGVAEFIGYLNGINYPDFLSFPTFITKCIGVTLAVCGKLCIGKEGPLAHIGAICGSMVPYFPFIDFRFLQNDENRRILIAAGGSCGVSVAFGAPVGGTLFAYEMSKPNTFWTFEMIWMVFISCSVGVAWLQTLNAMIGISPLVKFGSVSELVQVDTYELLVPTIAMGIAGGCMGSFFINVNTRMAVLRKRLLTKKWMKPLETLAFSFVTASCFYWVTFSFRNSCIPLSGTQTHITYLKGHKPTASTHEGAEEEE